MNKPLRSAKPGDIFLLLLPTGDDLVRLIQDQQSWQTRFGGQPVSPIHITAERFSPKNGQLPQGCVTTICENISTLPAFQAEADALIQFFAPYWQSYVLRWRVKESPIWNSFREQVKSTLEQIDCPSHFWRQRHATCTILKLDNKINLPSPPPEISMPLFYVREVHISTLKKGGNFEILEKFSLQE
jgi:hypothetical protein